ncbi:MAG: hypothetical protein KAT25_02925 [Sulfuriflexus sp.]|nr:hypothetical protein [Sulfuriflexus sp.]
MANMTKNVDPAKLDISITLLRQYVNDPSIEPLIFALEALKKDPSNESLFGEFSDAFSALGIAQGSVLTYAPYISSLLSNDLFD